MIHYTTLLGPVAGLMLALALPVGLFGQENTHEKKHDYMIHLEVTR